MTKEKIATLATLMQMEPGQTQWIVPEILPEGLTILSGSPKVGKSWMALALALSVGTGGKALNFRDTEQGEVLYLALEDNPKTLTRRVNTIGKHLSLDSSEYDSVTPIFNSPTKNQEGLKRIEEWIRNADNPRLVLIDTMQMFTGLDKDSSQPYARDYHKLTPLKKLASRYGIAIVLIHHDRKKDSDDYIDTVSGTTGLTGCADTIWSLKRERNSMKAVLHVTGRSIEEESYALEMVQDGLWEIQGTAESLQLSEEREEIVSLLREFDEPLFPREIAEALGKNGNTVRGLIRKLYLGGFLERTTTGRYRPKEC